MSATAETANTPATPKGTPPIPGAQLPYSHEIDWPDGLAPWTVIDEKGTQGEPYAHFKWMREHHPVLRVHHPSEDVYFLSRYQDVRKGMRSPKIFLNQVNNVPPFAFPTLLDGAAHVKLRKVIASAFIPKTIALVTNRVREVAEARVKALVDAGGGEVVNDVSRPLTIATISGILGVPVEDLDKIHFLSDQMFVYFARLSRMAPGTDDDEKYTKEFFAYLNMTLRRLHEEKSESVAGHIARSWLDDGVLTEDEATELCAFVFVAGFETTERLIAAGFRELEANPDLLRRLRDNPEQDSEKFIEELVRFRGPVHKAPRRTTEDFEFAGVMIPKGSIVRLLLASANRDESQWPHADQFDIDRETDGHFGFGHGVHACVGAPLARLESKILFQVLARDVESVEFDPQKDLTLLKGNSLTNGVDTLTVKVTPRQEA
ncbi:cytochrome P450 [Arthrobacter sp. MMS18-M83]|uniref:cytochrome P450 n=1 Tax=Arthrobacter sp. MMS18-M83 TaxID=2996261 RepID=UPI00227D2B94|nr:cytochrome P450 [Arthrobacter sp. MMS18-M83]WAH96325.1 cytochrome P450 [Arthrobacter sp. MMS18-M83]